MTRPYVNTRALADHYAAKGQRIVEFLFPSGKGGLISLRTTADGREIVELYRVDEGIILATPTEEN